MVLGASDVCRTSDWFGLVTRFVAIFTGLVAVYQTANVRWPLTSRRAYVVLIRVVLSSAARAEHVGVDARFIERVGSGDR